MGRRRAPFPGGRPSGILVLVDRAACPGRRIYTRTFVDSARRAQAFELMNKRHKASWAGRFWVDDDGELVCDYALNVTAQGMAAENVSDILVRMSRNWEDFHGTVKPVLRSAARTADV